MRSDESDGSSDRARLGVVTPFASVTEDRPGGPATWWSGDGSPLRCLETARGALRDNRGSRYGPFKPRQIEERGPNSAITGTTTRY